MPDRTYTVIYDTSTAIKAAQDTSAFADAVDRLGRSLGLVLPLVKQLGVGVPRNLANCTKGADALATSLKRTGDEAAKTSLTIKTLGMQAGVTGSSLRTAGQHGGLMGKIFGEAGDRGLHLNATLARVAYAAAGIKSAVALYEKFTSTMHDVEEYANECAKDLIKIYDKVREIEAITGKTAAQVVTSQDELRARTGLSETEVQAFDTKWESAITMAKEGKHWKLNEAETKDVKEAAAGFAKAQGIDPTLMADIIPRMGVVEDVSSVKQAKGVMAAIQQMGVESADKFNPVLKAATKEIGTMIRPEGGGAFKSMSELMAATSAMTSLGAPAKIPTQMEQVWRQWASPINDKVSDFYKQVGIKPGETDFLTNTEKMADYFAAQKAKGISPEMAMKSAGFTRSPAANLSMIKVTREADILRKRLAKVHEAEDPDFVDTAREKYEAEQPMAFAAAAVDKVKHEKGESEKLLVGYRQYIEAGLERRGYRGAAKEGGDPVLSYREWLGMPINRLFGHEGGREQTSDETLTDIIRARMPKFVEQHQRSFRDAEGPTGMDRRIEGKELGELINTMTPEERKVLDDAAKEYAGAGGRVRAPSPATKRAGTAGAPIGPAAMMGSGIDGRLVAVNETGNRLLRDIRDAIQGGSDRGYIGPLTVDGADSGPRRS